MIEVRRRVRFHGLWEFLVLIPALEHSILLARYVWRSKIEFKIVSFEKLSSQDSPNKSTQGFIYAKKETWKEVLPFL